MVPPELEKDRVTFDMPVLKELVIVPETKWSEEIEEPLSTSVMVTVEVVMPVAERESTAEPLESSSSDRA